MTDPNKDALREAVGNIMRIARGASNPALELLADRICALPTIALLDEVEAELKALRLFAARVMALQHSQDEDAVYEDEIQWRDYLDDLIVDARDLVVDYRIKTIAKP